MQHTIKLRDLTNRPVVNRDKDYPNFMKKMTDEEIKVWIEESVKMIRIEYPELCTITDIGSHMIATLIDNQILFDILTISPEDLKNHRPNYYDQTQNAFIDYYLASPSINDMMILPPQIVN